MPDIERIAEIFQALSDPTRLRLIKLLGNQPPLDAAETLSQLPLDDCPDLCNGQKFLCVNALAHHLGVTQSAVSQHLRVLRQAGLVQSERRGSFMHYSLDKRGLQQYIKALEEVLGKDFTV
jgi:DNA-binding transcriptional ArsR family regulator